MSYQVQSGRERFIYALHDPTDVSQKVYVGVTTNPKHRMYGHRGDARKGTKRYCCNWVRSLLARGTDPRMEVLEVVPPNGDWVEAEQHWIASLRYMGVDLMNHTAGGEGTVGYRPSQELRARRSAQLKGRKMPPEFGAKISAGKRGKPHRVTPLVCQSARIKSRGATLRKDNPFGFRGVGMCRKMYTAHCAGQYLGSFATIQEAALVFDDTARSLWGAEAAVNFPRPGEKSARPGIEPQEWDLPAPPPRKVHGFNRNNRSGYRGVSWSASAGKWYASTKLAGKSLNLGYYDDPAEAHRAYCAARAQKGGQ